MPDQPKRLTAPGTPQIEEQPPVANDGEQVYAIVAGSDEFDSLIDGVPVLTRIGVAVPAELVDELKASAKSNNVAIRKVG